MKLPILFLLAILTGGAANASILLSGSFSSDDQLQLFTVSMLNPGTLTVQSTGYAGGGFDTVLSLFTTDSSETLLALNNDGVCAFCYDASLSLALGSGRYLLVLTQYDNLPFGPGFADGFTRTGQGNFTPGLSGFPGTSFLDSNGNQRTASWSLVVTGASAVTTIPEPSTLLLLAVGLMLAAGRQTLRCNGRRT